jgi:hypothetical protein
MRQVPVDRRMSRGGAGPRGLGLRLAEAKCTPQVAANDATEIVAHPVRRIRPGRVRHV